METRSVGTQAGGSENDKERNDVLLHNNKGVLKSVLSTAVEAVARWSLPNDKLQCGETLTEYKRIISEDLAHSYFTASGPNRRFLKFSHFRVATEVEVPGSWKLFWCSLCKLPETFALKEDLEKHYNDQHRHNKGPYSCDKCATVIEMPSDYIHHVRICGGVGNDLYRSELNPRIADGYVYYSKHEGEIEFFTDPDACDSCGATAPKKPKYVFEMDPVTLRPIGGFTEMKSTYLILRSSTDLEMWDLYRYSCEFARRRNTDTGEQ